jgi:hypothetical protein
MHARRFAFYLHLLHFTFEIRGVRGSPPDGSAGAAGVRQTESAADTGRSASSLGDWTVASRLKGKLLMHNYVKRASISAVVGGALLAAGGFGLAHAAPPESVVNDGKVNVTVTAGGQQVGILQDVSLASAAALAASACPSAGITPEAIQALDVNGVAVPGTCAGVEGGPTFTFAQNGPGNSETAPGQSRTSTPTTTTTPSTTAAR